MHICVSTGMCARCAFVRMGVCVCSCAPWIYVCIVFICVCIGCMYTHARICDSIHSVVSINMWLNMWAHIQRYVHAFLGSVYKCDSCVYVIIFKHGSPYVIMLLSMEKPNRGGPGILGHHTVKLIKQHGNF